MWKSFRGLAAENVEKFPWVSRGKCGKVSVGGCLAATCGHLRPLEWLQVAAENVEKFPWEKVRRPLAATCGHSSGCKRLQVAAGDKRMLAATCGHSSGCKWLPVTRKCCHLRPLAATRVAVRGCKWLPVTRECWRPLAATCGHWSGCRWQENAGGHLRPRHLRPLAATRVAASGCKWLPVTRKCCHLRPLAATRVAVRGCKWLPVTRECWRPLAATGVAAGDKRMLAATCGHATCGHLRPLEWLQVAASGCKWLPWQENAGGHLRPLAATRVAASGCHFQNQITRLLRAQWSVKKKEDPGTRKGRKVAKHYVFPMTFPMTWGSGGSKSRLAKAAGAAPAGQMKDEKLHAVVARSTFRNQNKQIQNTPGSDHFWKLKCRKSARRCGAKHISKSKC